MSQTLAERTQTTPRLAPVPSPEHQRPSAPTAREHLTGTTWHAVCRFEDLEPMWGEAALIDGQQIALVRLPDDRLFAVDHHDPVSKANVMARGIVGSRRGRPTLASPIHKQVYDLITGECLSEDGPQLSTYAIREESGTVQILV